MDNLPDKFVQTIIGVHGSKGKTWLDHLPDLIVYCEKTWSLKVLPPFALSYNYVAPATLKDGSSAVIKLYASSPEAAGEIAALSLFKGNGVCRLIDADSSKGILLLEQLEPGNNLKSVVSEQESALIAVTVIRQLHTSNEFPHGKFATVERWFRGLNRLRSYFNGSTGPIPESMLNSVIGLYPELCATTKIQMLLHGDLHHENILSAQRQAWLAIDPKGVVGETEYELIPFLINNLPDNDVENIIANRVNIFAKHLKLDKYRIYQWGFCHCVLSAWWCIEDQTGGVEETIKLARIFEKMKS